MTPKDKAKELTEKFFSLNTSVSEKEATNPFLSRKSVRLFALKNQSMLRASQHLHPKKTKRGLMCRANICRT